MISATRYKVPTAHRGVASLIYFNYQDSGAARLVQDALRLVKFMDGYGHKVLLKSQSVPSFLDLSEKDEKTADVVLPPTKTNFFNQLIGLAEAGWAIDLFLFCHGRKGDFGGVNAALGSEGSILNTEITSRLGGAESGLQYMPIRVVWGTDCEGSTRNALWTRAGAKAASGSRATNFYPNGAGRFIDAWNKCNVSYEQAVREADSDAVRTVVQTYLALVDAPAQKKAGRWCGCGFGKTVLGDDACAKEYFSKCWYLGDDWQAGKSGKEMMNYSSFKLLAGDTKLTKNSRPVWP